MEPNPLRQWHYESSGEREGPVPESGLISLLTEGKIGEATLVWCDELTDWAPLGETLPLQNLSSSDSSDDSAEPLVVCAFSGDSYPRSRMLPFGDQWVHPDYRDDFVQKLSEGESVDEDVVEGAPFQPTLTLSSLVSQSWKIWRSQWKEVSLLILIFWVPLYILSDFLTYEVIQNSDDAFEFQSIGREFRLQRTMEVWVGSLATCGIFAMIMSRWNGGTKWSLSDFFRAGGQHYARLLGTRLLLGLVAIGALLVTIIPIVLIPVEWLQIGLGVAAGFFAIYALTRLSLTDSMPILLGRGGWEPIRRSWQATKGHFWRLTGYRIVVYSVVLVVAAAIGVLFLIPVTEHFVISGIIAAFIDVVTAGSVVFEFVLASHLNKLWEPSQMAEVTATEVDSAIDT